MEGKFDGAAFSAGDVMRRLRNLEKFIREGNAGRRLENAAVGAGGLRLHGGGTFRYVDENGVELVYIGRVTNAFGQQSSGYLFKGANNRQVFELQGDPDGQFWALYDEGRNIIFSDDAATGYGIARPYLDIPMYPTIQAEFTGTGSGGAWPSTAATTATPMFAATPHLWHPKISFDIVAASDGGTTNWQILINNTVVGSGTGNAAGDVLVPGWGSGIIPGQAVLLDVKGWRTGGGTRVWMQIRRMAGRQT